MSKPFQIEKKSIAIGVNAGKININTQNNNAIAIGFNAGQNNQGENAIAIGKDAGINQHNNSIIINATGSVLNTDTSNSIIIKPIKQTNQDTLLSYNLETKQVSHFNQSTFSTLLNTFNSIPFENVNYVNTDLSSNLSNPQWEGGVLANNGRIYMIPAFNQSVLVYNPVTKLADTKSIIVGGPNIHKYSGGVLAKNKKIYCAPYDADNILVIKPFENDFYTISINREDRKWEGAVLGPDNSIYCIPSVAPDSTSHRILKIDPSGDIVTTINVTVDAGVANNAWAGGVFGANGRIYCIPREATEILIINFWSGGNLISPVITSLTIAGRDPNSQWQGGALATNGFIYAVPRAVNSILRIDPSNNNTSLLNSSISGFNGAVYAPNGKIYGMPFLDTQNNILVIDTEKSPEIITSIPLPNPSNVFKYKGGVLTPQTKIIGVPQRENRILEMNTSIPLFYDWMIQAYYNKY